MRGQLDRNATNESELLSVQRHRKDLSPSITNLCVDGGHDVETSIDPSEHAWISTIL